MYTVCEVFRALCVQSVKCTTMNIKQYFLCLEMFLAAIVSYSAKKKLQLYHRLIFTSLDGLGSNLMISYNCDFSQLTHLFMCVHFFLTI